MPETPEDSLHNVSSVMRDDWDRRAREDACYYAAFGRRKQDLEEFFSSADEVLRRLKDEFRRFPPETDFRKLTALEIGCGPGRLMVPMSAVFGRVWGVDIAPAMIELARRNLAGIQDAEVRLSGGSDLAGFPDASVDFCYSYAVFQHIPDKEVIRNYLREAYRVLKPGGILKCQVNGLPYVGGDSDSFPKIPGWSLRAGTPSGRPHVRVQPDTWSGVSFCGEEIAHFAAQNNLRLLFLDGFHTQYLWATMRKPSAASPGDVAHAPRARIARITNTFTDDSVVPQAGRFASAALRVPWFADQADLNNVRIDVDGQDAAPSFIGKHAWSGPVQINVYLPPNTRSGVLPVRLKLNGAPVSDAAPMRVIPPGRLVPRLLSVTDSVNLLSTRAIDSRAVKINIEEVPCESDEELRRALRAELGGRPIEEMEIFCIDPLPRRFEVSLGVPGGLSQGNHVLNLRLGRRKFPPVEIYLSE